MTTTPFLTERILMPCLSEFWNTHPGAEISLFPSRDFVDVLAERFDLAIRAISDGAPQVWRGTDQIEVGRVSLVGIASPLIFAKGPIETQQLPWLWHDGMDPKIELMRQCGLDVDGLTQVKIGSPNLLLKAVRQGIGVALFNESIARQEMAVGGIVEVPLPKAAEISYFAILPKGPRHPLAEPFLEWVKTLL